MVEDRNGYAADGKREGEQMELGVSNGRPDTNDGPNSCDCEPSDGDRKANEMKCASYE